MDSFFALGVNVMTKRSQLALAILPVVMLALVASSAALSAPAAEKARLPRLRRHQAKAISL